MALLAGRCRVLALLAGRRRVLALLAGRRRILTLLTGRGRILTLLARRRRILALGGSYSHECQRHQGCSSGHEHLRHHRISIERTTKGLDLITHRALGVIVPWGNSRFQALSPQVIIFAFLDLQATGV